MTSPPISPALERRLERLVQWCTRHWLLLVNIAAMTYAGVPWLAPLASASGHPLLGALLFRLYTPLCHQRPERSFVCMGHQVAFCHRCTAMYGGIALAGLLFGLVRRYVRPASLRLAGLLLLPMLLDGGTHLIDDLTGLGLRGGGDAVGTLNFWLRMITGGFAAVAAFVALYPRLEQSVGRVRDQAR